MSRSGLPPMAPPSAPVPCRARPPPTTAGGAGGGGASEIQPVPVPPNAMATGLPAGGGGAPLPAAVSAQPRPPVANASSSGLDARRRGNNERQTRKQKRDKDEKASVKKRLLDPQAGGALPQAVQDAAAKAKAAAVDAWSRSPAPLAAGVDSRGEEAAESKGTRLERLEADVVDKRFGQEERKELSKQLHNMRNQRSARKMRASNKALAEQAARLRVAPIIATPEEPDQSGGDGGGGGGGDDGAGGGEGGAGSGGDDAGTGGGWLSGGGSWSPNDGSVSSNGSSGSRGGCGTGGAEWWDDSGTFRDASAGAPRAYCWWACALILAAAASYTPAATPSCVHERPRHLSHQAATATPAAARWPDLCRSPPRWATRRPPRGHAQLGGGCGGGGAIVGRGDAYKVPSSVQAAC